MDASFAQRLGTARRISGLTHNFYRYPAAAPPDLVREIILRLTNKDDYILDPFMGGGTTLVEALAHGRRAIGFDVSTLAAFVSRVKTTPLTESDRAAVQCWLSTSPFEQRVPPSDDKRTHNLPEQALVPLSSALAHLHTLGNSRQRAFLRCALLRVTQWALESQDDFPCVEAMESKLEETVSAMYQGLDALIETARSHGISKTTLPERRTIFRASAAEAPFQARVRGLSDGVRLVLTSPPYPGVHVLYHRWQIRSRRETAAAFWIARHRDGFGPSYYTLGGRSETGQKSYFEHLKTIFFGLRPLLARDARVAQLVAFSNPSEQLPMFHSAMEGAGYSQTQMFGLGNSPARRVPNRRWYVRGTDLEASKEYFLFYAPRF